MSLLVLQTAVGLVLVGAAITKAWTRTSVRPFLVALGAPASFAALVAVSVIPAELLGGLMLVIGIGPVATYFTAILCAVFAVLLVVAYRSGVTEGCRCFGSLDEKQLTLTTVARSVVLAVAASSAAFLAHGAPSAGLHIFERSAVPAMGLGALMALAYVVVFALLAEVVKFEQATMPIRKKALRNSSVSADILGRLNEHYLPR